MSRHLIPVRGAHRDRHEARDGWWWTQAAPARRQSQGGKPWANTARTRPVQLSRTAKPCRP